MMFDIAWSELVVIGAVALIVIGPKDLPKTLRTLGKMTAKLRLTAYEFRSQFDAAMREAELEDLRKEVASLNEAVPKLDDVNPLKNLRDEVKGAVEGPKPATKQDEGPSS